MCLPSVSPRSGSGDEISRKTSLLRDVFGSNEGARRSRIRGTQRFRGAREHKIGKFACSGEYASRPFEAFPLL